MANYPPPYPPPPPPAGPPYGNDWRYQRRIMKQQARMQLEMARAQRDAYRYHMRAGRRSSIVGPLLMIAIGIIVLLEWAFDQYFRTDDAIPRRRSIGGGVLFLLIIFGVCGIIVSGIHSGHDFFGHAMHIDEDNMDQFWGDKHESEQALAQALPAGSSILIDNPRGDVSVTGTSDDNQVHITVHKEVYTRSDSEADN